LSDLRERLARGPKQIQAREAHVAKLQQDLGKLHDNAKSCRISADKKQLDLRTSENKIIELRTKLNACSSNKEYQALLDQIAAAEMANSVLSDEILEALEQIDGLDANVATAEEELITVGADLDKVRGELADAAVSIRADVARLEAELTSAEKSLPEDIKSGYDRIVKAKGQDALAAVDDDTCGGCYQQITANMQNDLALGRAVFCRSCGRLLYPAEPPAR